MNSLDVILYSRAGCHLCEDVDLQLQQQGIAARIIDIDSDPVLREKYDVEVPVVMINGRERFRGRVDPVLLRRTIEGERCRPGRNPG